MDKSATISKASLLDGGLEVGSGNRSAANACFSSKGESEEASPLKSLDLAITKQTDVRSSVEQRFRQMNEAHDRIRSQQLTLRLSRAD